MIALPDHLVNAYELAKNSELVTKDKSTPVTNSMIREFANIINDTIPTPKRNTYALYKFVRAAWKQGNLKDLTKFEPLVLWLDNTTIMEHFNVKFDFMFRWDNAQHRYGGHVFTKIVGGTLKSPEPSTLPVPKEVVELTALPDDGYALMFNRIKSQSA